MKIELTTHWPVERVSAVWPDVVRCLTKFCDRFPRDETVDNLVRQILTGALQLWVIEDDGRFIMAVVSRITTVTATGKVQVQILALGGERGEDVMVCLKDIEDWGRDQHGAEEFEITGRKGWQKRLSALGYRSEAIIYRKQMRKL